MKRILLYIIMLAFVLDANAQNLLRYRIEKGDTVYYDVLPSITVYGRRFNSNRDYRQYRRMVYNLRKVYPYAVAAKRKMAEMDKHYLSLKTDKERKAYAKTVEKQLLAEFDAPLRKLTISQGALLIKLIDRETGRTSFSVIKAFRGGFSASLWQGVARIFGHNLKTEYDALGNDKILEELVQKCEDGTFDELYFSMFPK